MCLIGGTRATAGQSSVVKLQLKKGRKGRCTFGSLETNFLSTPQRSDLNKISTEQGRYVPRRLDGARPRGRIWLQAPFLRLLSCNVRKGQLELPLRVYLTAYSNNNNNNTEPIKLISGEHARRIATSD